MAKLWVTQDNCGAGSWICIWLGDKPTLWSDGDWVGDDMLSVCAKEFERLFGFLPPKGKAVKVEFTAKLPISETHNA